MLTNQQVRELPQAGVPPTGFATWYGWVMSERKRAGLPMSHRQVGRWLTLDAQGHVVGVNERMLSGRDLRSKGTCDACGMVRMRWRYGDGWRHYCDECAGLSEVQRKVVYAARRAAPTVPRIAYPCVGGPLDGVHVVAADFREGGMYAHLSRSYVEYNRAGGGRGGPRIGQHPPTMIHVYREALPPLGRPAER